MLKSGVAVEVAQLVEDEDYLGNAALRHSLRADLLLIFIELLQGLLASIDQNGSSYLCYLKFNLIDAFLCLCLLQV